MSENKKQIMLSKQDIIGVDNLNKRIYYNDNPNAVDDFKEKKFYLREYNEEQGW